MAPTTLPTTTSYVDQNWFLEPIKGPKPPRSYLDRFPEEVYNTGPDSQLAKFIYVLLGPSGVGYLRQNALEARLALEDMGIELFDLDAFYGEPLRFTRVLDELYDEDPRGLIDRDAWDKIRAKDAKYRSRVLDFLDGARAGSTPLGMRYAARSGLGHDVAIIENYKRLFDEHSDDPLYLEYWGKTRLLEEFTVLPRRNIMLSEVQKITISGSPTGGWFTIIFRGEETDNIAWNAPAGNVQTFLEDLPSILPGDVEVTGGPLPNNPIRIRFMGTWSARDVPQVRTTNLLTGGSSPLIQSTTEQSGVDAADEIAYISPRDHHHLQEALDRIRPQTAIPTTGAASGLRARQLWGDVHSTSSYDEVIRYVTGSPSIEWPGQDSINWIERGKEHAAPKAINDRQYQYLNYHIITDVSAFTESAIEDAGYGGADTPSIMEANRSAHIGPFSEFQRTVFPYLGDVFAGQYEADMVLADYAEPLTISNVLLDPNTDATIAQLINKTYPTHYADLPGAPTIKYDYEQFWASSERVEGTDYLEIDLGIVKAINYINFEIMQKPVDITVHFDRLDQPPRRIYEPVQVHDNQHGTSNLSVNFAPENQNPWNFVEYSLATVNDSLIFTRFLRIGFTRRNDAYSPFAINGGLEGFHPWSVDVRNLRVGRNVSNVF